MKRIDWLGVNLRLCAVATVLALAAIVTTTVSAAGGDWTWVNGPDTANQAGNYGSIGITAASNLPPGRSSPATWTDHAGNFWLFGGFAGMSSNGLIRYDLNDLWKWDGTSWTWVSGSNAPNQAGNYGVQSIPAGTNVPGARESAQTWVDQSNNLWLFGGYGLDSAGTLDTLGDLWKWDGTNWTWVSGSTTVNPAAVYGSKGVTAGANYPGGRNSSGTWTDSAGNFWLFGGQGCSPNNPSACLLDDLWKFDGTNWTWVAGPNTVNQAGSYGAKGVTAGTNLPKARMGSAQWLGSDGSLWIFGGFGGIGASSGWLNDLWKWDGANWTWMAGASTLNQGSSYGTPGVPASANTPGARTSATAWVDSGGNLWLFGGNLNTTFYNDLWRWDGKDWALMTSGGSAHYGTLGTGSASNVPGARTLSGMWLDQTGSGWLFGGSGKDHAGTSGMLNDVWRFEPPLPAASLSAASLSFGSQPSGSTGAYKTVTVTNTGAAPLTVSAVSLTGSSDFAITSETCSTAAYIAATSTCAVSLRFTPSTAGAQSATLSIAGDFAASPSTVSLSGTGAASGSGASIVVTTASDTTANDGLCTLREAITNANADNQSGSTDCAAGSGADTITFAANYIITLSGSQLPAVTSTMTITGNGAANTIVQANASPNVATYRVLQVNSSGNLALTNLTVQNGRCAGACNNGQFGGGISNLGTLSLSGVTVSGNSTDYLGGGIGNDLNANLTVTGSIITNNSALATGSGISSLGAASVTGSCIVGNNGLAFDTEIATGQVATGNWWGDASGPGPYGAGDVASPDVAAGGFLTAPILGCASNPAPATITVNSNLDGTLAALNGNGTCDLREAITNANADNQSGSTECAAGSGHDTIVFSGAQTITLSSTLPYITSPMVIDGNGMGSTIIQASTCNPVTLPGGCTPATYNVFVVGLGGVSPGSLLLKDLTVRHGNCIGTNCSGGGGIFGWGGALTLDGVAVQSNKTTGQGGGISTGAMQVTVRNGSLIGGVGAGNKASQGGGIYDYWDTYVDASTVSANTATSAGGGIFNYGALTVRNGSMIGGPGAGNVGGGIASAWRTIIDGSTVSYNTSSGQGGGINSSSTATNGLLVVRNGSLIQNNTGTFGGGIFSSDPVLTVTGSIIKANTATLGTGGGIYVGSSGGTSAVITGSCIAGNSNTGLATLLAGSQTATGDWWGAPTGPNTAGADTTSGNWNTSGYLTSASVTCNGGPFNLSASAVSATTVTLTWTDAATDETSFRIERSADGSSGWTEIGAALANATSYQDTTAPVCSSAFYRVKARNASGDSPYTPVASVSASCAQPGPTFTVNTAADSNTTCDVAPGDCSLREAINAANAHAGPDTIAFNISGSGLHTIALSTSLPAITQPVTIDGTTQPGASCAAWPPTLTIQISGPGGSTSVDGLTITGGGSTVRGLVLNQLQRAVYLQTQGNNTVSCNYVGTNASGSAASPNIDGIYLSSSSGNVIGGLTPADRNLVSGNSIYGIAADLGANNNTIEGNYVGTTAAGNAALCPTCAFVTAIGIFGTDNNLIGGPSAGARNIISGNHGEAIFLSGSGNRLENNYIGTDPTGTVAVGNRGIAVDVLSPASGTQIINNLISGNASGIQVDTGAGDTTQIVGNKIGTDVTGRLPLNDLSIPLPPSGSMTVYAGGIALQDTTGTEIRDNIIAHQNQFAANGNPVQFGVGFKNGAPGTVSGNCVYDNTFALLNLTASNVNFTNTWWGTPLGPVVGTDIGGDGQNNVNFTPFLTTAPAICAPAVSLTATSHDFGGQQINSTSAPFTVTLSNSGIGPLLVGQLTVSGDFALSTDGCSGQLIAADGTCAFGITFTPASAGAKTGSVSIASDASSSPDVITLSGAGTTSAILPPVLTAPKNGAAVLTFTPKLTWKAVKGATGYHVEIADTADFSHVVQSGDPAKNTFTPPALGYGVYYWHVASKDASGLGAYSAAFSFEVTLNKTPKKNAPVTTTTPKFTWQAVKGVTSYQLEVYTDAGDCAARNVGTRQLNVTSSAASYTTKTTEALGFGQYYWHVSPDGGSSWTPCWGFEVTLNKTPASGATVKTHLPKFTWQAVKGVAGYLLQVNDKPDFSGTMWVDVTRTTASYTVLKASPLPSGTYYWQVSIDGGSTWTLGWSFTIP